MPHNSDASADSADELILVDADDNIVGHLDKNACHEGEGVRHRAFSVFLFDPVGCVLLQQRSAGKRLWPGVWSNSVCSHPRRGETIEEAAVRRVTEELGIECDLRRLYRFEYRARDDERGAEYELCWVLVGRVRAHQRASLRANPDEISTLRWVDPVELDRALDDNLERFTPWSRMEWQRLRGDQREALEQAIEQALEQAMAEPTSE